MKPTNPHTEAPPCSIDDNVQPAAATQQAAATHPTTTPDPSTPGPSTPGPSTPDHANPTRDTDALIVELAARQHGVVARAQLRQAGVAVHAIDYRVSTARLERLHRGVYRVVGPLRATYEREMAAVLACGEAAVLSHRSAAFVWKLLPFPRREGTAVQVSIRRGYRRPGGRVRVYRFASMDPDETTVVHRIPVTAPARTLLDLAGSVSGRELEQAVARAEREGLAERKQILALLARHPRSPGAATLRALLALEAGAAFVRSKAESLLLALVRRARLPAPRTNVVVEGYEVDFLWRAGRLVVEVDGYAFHSSSDAFERDRQRDTVLAAAGYRVIRVTWRQLSREPEALVARLAQALARKSRA